MSTQTDLEAKALAFIESSGPNYILMTPVQKLAAFARSLTQPKEGLSNKDIDLMIRIAPITTHMDLAQCIEVVLRHARDKGLLAAHSEVGDELSKIAAWCEEVFGPVKPSRLVSRAAEEMSELVCEVAGDEWTDAAREEAADVVIILTRVPGLMDAVRAKMEINKKREWKFNGDGTGYRVKPPRPTEQP